MYNDYNNDQNRSDYEYHYSYRSDGEGFQPAQSPAPMEVKPKKRRAGKIVAIVLCGALLIGGGFGAGWYLNRNDGQPDDAQRPAPYRGGHRQRHRQ